MANQLLQTIKTLSKPLKSSFGPNGTDTLIVSGKTSTITNDGATIMNLLQERSAKMNANESNSDFYSNQTIHPALKLLINLSKAQDTTAGDGTTSIVLLAGAMADTCSLLLEKYHSTDVAECLELVKKSLKGYFETHSVKIFKDEKEELQFEQIKKSFLSNGIETEYSEDINNKDISNYNDNITGNFRLTKFYESFYNAVKTSLSSKILNTYIEMIAPLAIETIFRTAGDFDKIKIKKLINSNGSLDDISLVNGYVIEEFDNTNIFKVNSKDRFYQTKVKKNIALCQFTLTSGRPTLDTSVIIKSSELLENLMRDEKILIKNLVTKIHKKNIDVIFVQKSLIKETVSPLTQHYLKKLGIAVHIIGRKEMEELGEVMNLKISTDIDNIEVTEMNFYLKSFENEEVNNKNSEIIKDLQGNEVVYIKNQSEDNFCTILITSTDPHISSEAERSLMDCLHVVNCLYQRPSLCYGGGNFELSFSLYLKNFKNYKNSTTNTNNGSGRLNNNENIFNNFPFLDEIADAFEMLPYYLASNSNVDSRIINDIKGVMKYNYENSKNFNNMNYRSIDMDELDSKNYDIILGIKNYGNEYNNFLSVNNFNVASKIKDNENSDEVCETNKNMRPKIFIDQLHKYFDCSELVVPVKVAESMVELVCETMAMIVRIDEVLPAYN